MDPISLLASTIAIYQLASKVTIACFRYAEGVRRADSEVDATIDEIDKFKNSLRDLSALLQDERLHGKIGEERLQSLQKTMSENGIWLKACNDDLTKMQAKLEGQEAQGGLKGQAKALLNKMKWPLKQEEIQRLLENMRHVREQIAWAQNIDNLTITRAVDTRTRRIEATTKAIDATVKQTNVIVKEMGEHIRESDDMRRTKEEQKENENTIKSFAQWLADADPTENHNLACDARNKDANTGLWFLEGQKYVEFKTSHPSLLWLHGDPGSGKTILAATAIENLKASLGTDSRLALAFWYFNANDRAKKSLDQCLRSLLAQLAGAFKNKIPAAIKSLWTSKGQTDATPRLYDLKTTLTKIISEEKMEFYLVLDALDEAQNDHLDDLLELIHSLLNADGAEVSIMVTSRLWVKTEFQERFEKALFFDISIEREYVDQDIRAHIAEKLKSDGKLNKWKPELRVLISEKLLDGAEGMFRWVDCQLDAVRRCNTPSAVKRTLSSLPKNLQEQYRRELGNISSVDDAQTVVSILRWLAFPSRKITLAEAAEIVAVEFDGYSTSFDPEKKLIDSYVIFELCGSLVRIDENKEGTNHLGEHVDGVQSLTTSHNTVLDFLTSENIKVGPLEAERFSRAAVHYKLAVSCLTYLTWLFENVSSFSEDTLGDHPCARLSAEYFDDYIREVIADQQESLDIKELNEMVIDIMDDEESLLKLVQLCNPDSVTERVNFSLEVGHLSSPLYYAALLGLPDVVKHYLDMGSEKDFITNFGYGSPLAAAAAEGRKSCVKILLDEGADPNLSGQSAWGVPLAAAVEKNHVDIVKMLLQREDVDVDCTRGKPNPQSSGQKEQIGASTQQVDNNTATTDSSHEESSESDEQEARKGSSMTEETAAEPMLYIAAAYNSPEAMDILLEHGANVNAIGGSRHTALQAACAAANEPLVKKLLEANASSAIYGGVYGGALLAACDEYAPFSINTYTKLLDAGVDVNRKGGSDTIVTALHCAACGTDPEILQLLIDRGAEINVRGVGSWDNPLQGACANGTTENVRILLENGADTSLQGAGTADNCMMAAAMNANLDIVKILLEKNVSPNIQGGELSYPLIAACHNLPFAEDGGQAYVDVIKLLLDAGANPNAVVSEPYYKDCCAFFIVSATTSPRQIDVLKLLVEHGADVNTSATGIYTGPLYNAMSAGNLDVVKYLLEQGVSLWNVVTQLENDVVISKHDAYLLGLGINDGHSLDIIKMMVEACELDTVDDFNRGSALHIATRSNNFELVDLLLEAGANPDIVHWDSGSVLSAAAVAKDSDEMIDKLYPRVTIKNATNMIGQDAMLSACRSNGLSAVRKLLGYGYKMEVTDKRGCNGLHYAAACSSVDLVSLAIDSGINVNSTDSGLWTPLHYAAASTNPSALVLEALLRAGADPTCRDVQGLTAASLAFGFGKSIEFEVLRGKQIPEDLLFKGRTGLSFFYKWRDEGCRGCGASQKPTYYCKKCSSYWLCFHCHAEKDRIHPKDHEWTLYDFVFEKLPDELRYPESDGSSPCKFVAEHLLESQNFKFEDRICTFGNSVQSDDNSEVVHSRGDVAFSSRTPYFEITIKSVADIEEDPDRILRLAIGVATSSSAGDHTGHPGWLWGSWGYHSDDGCLFNGSPDCSHDEYGETYGIGDTVGCGIDKYVTEYDEDLIALFFTKNGKHLGAFLVTTRERLVPILTTKNMGVVVEVNLGEKEFVWQGDPYKKKTANKDSDI